jgi:hypothetical protein
MHKPRGKTALGCHMPDDHLRRDDHLWQRQAAQRLAAHKKGHGSALCHWRVESQRHRVASQSRAPRDARNTVEGQHRPHLSRQIRPDCRNQMSKDRQILAMRRAFPQIFAKPVRKPLRQPNLDPGEVASATGRPTPISPRMHQQRNPLRQLVRHLLDDVALHRSPHHAPLRRAE